MAFDWAIGISYTTFDYSDLRIETPEADLYGTLVVSAIVTNSGARAGDEIVQLYVRDLVGSVTRPVRELKGFQRISLEPGEAQRVRFEVPVQQLGFHGPKIEYVVEPGTFGVWIGPNAAEGLSGTFSVVA